MCHSPSSSAEVKNEVNTFTSLYGLVVCADTTWRFFAYTYKFSEKIL